MPITVALDGPVARRGAGMLRRHFGARVEIVEVEGDADRATRFAEAAVLVAFRFDPGLPPAPKLKLLQVPASGLDAIDRAALPEGCALCNAYEHDVAIGEYVLGAMLAWTLDLRAKSDRFKAGSWADSPRLSGLSRAELAGRIVGLIGYGGIGRAVARRARAFEMSVVAVTRRPRELDPAPDWIGDFAGLDRVLAAADFLVVACPLTEATRGLIGAAQLARMKAEAVLINVARGPIVEQEALYEALADRRIAGAVLDTWYHYAEPGDPDRRPADRPFWQLDNVLMTPHLASWTDGMLQRRFGVVIENIERLIDGRPFVNQVYPGPESQ